MFKKLQADVLFPLAGLCIVIIALSGQIFMVPPMGKLADPFNGLIQNERDNDIKDGQSKMISAGAADSVSVYFDERKVPHIFAKNEADMYFTQGYVTASLRLWQMDFLTYVAAGRLSEIFSEGFTDYDRNQRRSGMLEAAEKTVQFIEQNPYTLQMLNAYTRGVNAYISKLQYKDFPAEYKLLDYNPEPWSNLKSVLVMKHMAAMLSGYDEDYMMTNLMLALGENNYNQLYNTRPLRNSPEVADSAGRPNEALAFQKQPDYLDFSFLSVSSVVTPSSFDNRTGSNSWAVSGKKTTSGHAILCNDPHLGMTLPAVWLEMQLSAPGTNVYGVSVPGIPAVLIGFNENIAWGITNGEGDARDWYKVKLSGDYSKYEMDGQWVNTTVRIETIKRRGQKPLLDTVYHTAHGPIVSDLRFSAVQPQYLNMALKWALHEPSNELATYLQLAKAKNYAEYRSAIATYVSPVQNFIFAGKNNDIAVNYQGRIPVKWPGQGKFILDGSKSTHLYSKYIPADSLPGVLNPASNYVQSANQHPTSNAYPYYYNGYYLENRANRIRQLLDSTTVFDVEKMKQMQLDNTSAFARDALAAILERTDRNKLTDSTAALLDGLRKWDGVYTAQSEQPQLFELWWNTMRDYTWDEIAAFSFKPRLPDDNTLLRLILQDPANAYFDRQGTTERETAPVVLAEAFNSAATAYLKQRRNGSVKWGDCNKVNLMHMTNIPILSRMNIASGGNSNAINAVSGSLGPSWRMIVEMGDRPRAFGMYPGGQSGNPGSRYFDNFVNEWGKGSYFPINFFLSATEAQRTDFVKWSIK